MRLEPIIVLFCAGVAVLASGCGGTTEERGFAPPAKSSVVLRNTKFSGPFQATLTVPTNRPRKGENWSWKVAVRTNSGKPLEARARVQFLFGGRVVGRGSHSRFKGKYGNTIRWPQRSVGFPLVFRVALTTPRGKANLDYPLQVRA